MSWWQRTKRDVKKFWDKELRPTVEPILRILVINRIKQEVDKHNKK